jgi:hypothetical protein
MSALRQTKHTSSIFTVNSSSFFIHRLGLYILFSILPCKRLKYVMCHKVEASPSCFLTYFSKLYFWFPSTVCHSSILMPWYCTVPQQSERWFICSLHCGCRNRMYWALDGGKTDMYLVVSKYLLNIEVFWDLTLC